VAAIFRGTDIPGTGSVRLLAAGFANVEQSKCDLLSIIKLSSAGVDQFHRRFDLA
jgi:hypothetical protein